MILDPDESHLLDLIHKDNNRADAIDNSRRLIAQRRKAETMKYLPILTLLLAWPAWAATPIKAPPSDTPNLSPIAQAVAKLTADASAYEATAGSLAVAQAQVAALTPTAGSLAQAVAQDQAALAALVNVPAPGPTPTPPSHTLGVVVVGGSGCAPCIKMRPILAKLAAAGFPIAEVDAATPAGQAWNVAATPTFIVTVDSKEILPQSGRRPVGAMDEATLDAWTTSLEAWFQATYPPTPPKAERR